MWTPFRRFFRWLITYLREARREMQKVNWPLRSEVGRMTLVVVLFSAAVALLLGGFDFVFGRALLYVLPETSPAEAPFGAPTVEVQDEPQDATSETAPPAPSPVQ